MNEIQMALAKHGYWATRKILEAAAGLTEEQWTAPDWHGLKPGLRARLVHCLDAERGWRIRFVTNPPSWGEKLVEDGFPTPASLAARWREDEREMLDWLAKRDDDALQVRAPLRQALPLWCYLEQVFLHSAQHRAEAALILTELGHSPGEIDFLYWAESPEAGLVTSP